MVRRVSPHGVLRLQAQGCRELRRYERVDVRFDFGLTVRLDADLVTPSRPAK